MTDEAHDIFGPSPIRAPGFADRLHRPAQPAVAGAAGEEVVGSGPYKPFGFVPNGAGGETCELRSWVDGTTVAEGLTFQYRFLMQVGFVGDEQLTLFFPDSIVVIQGRHLRDLRAKLARRMVTFVQAWNASVWTPLAPTETVIERIEVKRP